MLSRLEGKEGDEGRRSTPVSGTFLPCSARSEDSKSRSLKFLEVSCLFLGVPRRFPYQNFLGMQDGTPLPFP